MTGTDEDARAARTGASGEEAATDTTVRRVELSVDGGADLWEPLARDLASGRIDEAEWFDRTQAILTPIYLRAGNPRAQSGHSGDETRWEAARRPMLAAVDGPGDFLDIGCANGYLMESVHRWAAEDGHALEPYELVAAGHRIVDRRVWPKPDDHRVVRRVCWIDR